MMRDRHGMTGKWMLPDGMATAHPDKDISSGAKITFNLSSGKGLHAIATLRRGRFAPSLRIANSR